MHPFPKGDKDSRPTVRELLSQHPIPQRGERVNERDSLRCDARRSGTMSLVHPACEGWTSAYACMDWDKPAPCVTANVGEPSSGAHVLLYPSPAPHYRHISREQVLRLLSEPLHLAGTLKELGDSLPSTVLGAILDHTRRLFAPDDECSSAVKEA